MAPSTSVAATLLFTLVTALVAYSGQEETNSKRQDIMMALEAAPPTTSADLSPKEKADRAIRRTSRAAQKLLVYSTEAISNSPILPWQDVPEKPSSIISMRACRGEYEPGSFVVYPLHDDFTVEVSATALKGPRNAVIGSDALDIRVVKCWYQAGGGEGYSMPPRYSKDVGEKEIMILENTPVDEGRRILTPELLLKDDDLVRTEKWYRQNFLKLQYPNGKKRWLWISAPKVMFPDNTSINPWIMSPDTVGNIDDYSVEARPVKDADTLLPVTISKRTSKQFWITVHVPTGATPGDYSGEIHVSSKGALLETLALKLEVLPFDLEPNHLESSMYLHFFGNKGFIGMKLDENGQGSIGPDVRSVAQYRAELKNLLAHGVDNPTESTPLEQLELALQLRKEVGMKMDYLYHTFEGLGGWTIKPVDVERLKKVVALAKKFGYKEVYFYGMDEAQGERLKQSRVELEKIHQAGGKIFMAGLTPELGGDSLQIVGDLQDLMVMSYIPRKEYANAWHARGHKIMSYANPQSGFEKPETYRRNYGLLLDRVGYDGGMTFTYYWFGWNDFNVLPPYRDHMFVYPTVDGVIDTLAWEGYREGIDDLRYLATLRKAISETEISGSQNKVYAAKSFLAGADIPKGDLNVLRNTMIGWILELRSTRQIEK